MKYFHYKKNYYLHFFPDIRLVTVVSPKLLSPFKKHFSLWALFDHCDEVHVHKSHLSFSRQYSAHFSASLIPVYSFTWAFPVVSTSLRIQLRRPEYQFQYQFDLINIFEIFMTGQFPSCQFCQEKIPFLVKTYSVRSLVTT